MRNLQLILTVSCGLALATACSSSSQNASNDGGNPGTDGTVGDDASGGTGDDGGPGTQPSTPDATITCHGAVDCGGAGHSCCFSTTTFATMCVTGTCGMNYTQCVSMDSECPAGFQCVPSPIAAAGHYCAAGDGGRIAEGGATEGGSGVDSGGNGMDSGGNGMDSGAHDSGMDSGADASVDGPAE